MALWYPFCHIPSMFSIDGVVVRLTRIAKTMFHLGAPMRVCMWMYSLFTWKGGCDWLWHVFWLVSVHFSLCNKLICHILCFREQVRVNGFGVFFLLMYPGAFVDLSSEHLQVVSPLRQLRIYCAGVWHNFVIVVVALIILFSQPVILMPFYSTGQAVAITSVAEVMLLVL